MKVTKYAIVIGAALGAVSAQAQFGAVSKSDLSTADGKQGVYLSYNPFARISGGGSSANGYLLSAEKSISEGKFGPNVLGGFYTRLGGSGVYQVSYRMYTAEDASVALGILGGDGFSKNDFSAMYFKEFPKMENNPLMFSLGGGLYYDSSNSSANLAAAAKASYALQNGFSIDASFWYFHQGGQSANLITVGVGYRM
jgi:hypothetical protein